MVRTWSGLRIDIGRKTIAVRADGNLEHLRLPDERVDRVVGPVDRDHPAAILGDAQTPELAVRMTDHEFRTLLALDAFHQAIGAERGAVTQGALDRFRTGDGLRLAALGNAGIEHGDIGQRHAKAAQRHRARPAATCSPRTR